MSDELTDECYKKMLQSACFCYAYPESFSSVSLKQKPPTH